MSGSARREGTKSRVGDPASSDEASELPSESAEDSVDSLVRNVAHSPPLQERRVSMLLEPGAVVAGYLLRRSLGEGGMGLVWEAEHVATGNSVALKFLKRAGPNDGVARRFLREARAAKAVRHPNVVLVHDLLEIDDGSLVMVMELLQGETLADRLTRQPVIDLPDAARILVDVCAAVGCAHALGIVHRDLKPENIFLASGPDGDAVKVLDFGLAKLTAADGDAAHSGGTTAAGVILGTLLYMSPEQLLGEKDVDHRADVWALGTILYEMLSGTMPTAARSVGEVYKLVLTGAIVPLGDRAPHLPAPVLDLVGRMLARDRERRPDDVRQVLDGLSPYAAR